MPDYTESELRERSVDVAALAMIAGASLGDVPAGKKRHFWKFVISNRLATVERLSLSYGGVVIFSGVITPGGVPGGATGAGQNQPLVLGGDIKSPVLSCLGANAGTTPLLAIGTADNSIDVSASYYDEP
jgi:hypothetical protein